MASLVYRREVDGLRAVAVLPVILFHAGMPFFSGGFVGVDIFFVISGYLITSLLVAEHEAGSFSIVNFYERRARRILPALFLVILACLPAAWLILLPHELVDFGKSVTAVSLFGSNFLFWMDSDYFSPDSELIPLLHTWSLAVEEQYYVIFPLLLLLVWRLGKLRLSLLFGGIALVSLVLSEWLWRIDPAANFYLLPSRVWELMIGGLAAIYLRSHQPVNSGIKQAGSMLGLLMILASILLFDEGIPFPGFYALLPTVGAVLIILFATPSTWVGKLLAAPLLVAIGLISYSAYLWHQPLFAFARLMATETPSLWLFTGLSLLSLLLAGISWRFVEQPFRDRRRLTRGQIFWAAGLMSLLMIGIGLVLVIFEGFPRRLY